MIARHDGRIVFVAGAIPGERVEARVERVQQQLVWAETTRVDHRLARSRARCRRGWPAAARCWRTSADDRQRALKAEMLADALRRIGRIDLDAAVADCHGGPADGYRTRARIAFARAAGRASSKRARHRLCDLAASRQLDAGERRGGGPTGRGRRGGDARTARPRLNGPRTSPGRRASRTSPSAMAATPARLTTLAAVAGIDGVELLGGWEDPGPRAGSCGARTRVVDRCADGSGNAIAIAHGPRAFFQGNRYLLQTSGRRRRGAARGPGARPVRRRRALRAGGRRVPATPVTAVEGDPSRRPTSCHNAAGASRCRRPCTRSRWRGIWPGRAPQVGTVVVDPPRTGAVARGPGRRAGVGAGRGSSTSPATRRRWPATCAACSTPATGSATFAASTSSRAPATSRPSSPSSADARHARAASTKPSNSGRNSPVRQKFSGCHCTPRQKRAVGRSTASMTPSGAVATTSRPSPTCRTAWWWRLFTWQLSPSSRSSFISAAQPRRRRDPDLVRHGVARLADVVVEGAVHLGRDVLHEVAAEGDVQHLHAPANCQHRQVGGERGPHQRDLEGVAAGLGGRRSSGGPGAVERRVDVAAAGQQHAVHPSDHGVRAHRRGSARRLRRRRGGSTRRSRPSGGTARSRWWAWTESPTCGRARRCPSPPGAAVSCRRTYMIDGGAPETDVLALLGEDWSGVVQGIEALGERRTRTWRARRIRGCGPPPRPRRRGGRRRGPATTAGRRARRRPARAAALPARAAVEGRLVDAVAVAQLLQDVLGPDGGVLQVRPALALEAQRLVDVEGDDLGPRVLHHEVAHRGDADPLGGTRAPRPRAARDCDASPRRRRWRSADRAGRRP